MGKEQAWPYTRFDANGRLLIRVDRIRPMKGQPRSHQENGAVKKLALSIQSDGPEEAIKLIPIEGDQNYAYELVSGETRWLAHKLLNRVEIWGFIDKTIPNRKQQYRSAVRSNCHRRGISALETARAIKEMLSLGCTYPEIMSDFGFTTPTPIDQYLKILTLPKSVQDLMEPRVPAKRRLTFSVAYELGKMPAEMKVEKEKIAKEVVEHRLRHGAAVALIQRTLKAAGKEPKRRVREPRKDYQSLLSGLERQLEGITRYINLPKDEFDRMFSTRTVTASKMVVAVIDATVKKLSKMRSMVERAV